MTKRSTRLTVNWEAVAAIIITIAGILAIMAVPLHAGPIVGLYPDKVLTPGQFDPKVTEAMVCKHGYTAKVRNVGEAEHKAVFKAYGIDWKDHAKYEVDHLISLELGGTNDLTNLWPQPYAGVPYTARQKDQVEDYLHREVCAGKLKLQEAQKLIVDDWVSVYNHCCQGKGL